MRTRRTAGRAAVLGVMAGSLLWAAGCSKKDATPGQAVTGEPTQEVAKVNGKVITLGEVTQVVQALRAGQDPNTDRNAPEAELQKKAVDEMIGRELLFEAASKAGLEPSKEEVQAFMDQIQSRFPDSTAFRTALQQQGMTPTSLADNYRTQTAIRKYVKNTIQDTVQVTPEQARVYYDSHPPEFQHPEQVQARHILIRVAPDASPQDAAQAQSKTEGLLKELRAGGDFATLAQKNSQDGSAARGGDLGFFGRGQMVAPFDSVAFALEPGQTSGLVRTQFGYHIIRVDAKKPSGLFAFEDIQGQLVQRLSGMRVSERVEALIQEMKTRAKIKRKI